MLLPLIDSRRYDLVKNNYSALANQLSREGQRVDPFDLDFGPLEGITQRPGFDPALTNYARELNRARRTLAHLRPLSAESLRQVLAPQST